MARLNRVALERLGLYYRYLAELTAREPVKMVTSAQIAEGLDVDATQVRKDLAAIDVVGIGRVGFEACEVCRAIRFTLGFDQAFPAALIGAGNLGRALASYSGFAAGFARYGLRIVAAFDNDPRKVGDRITDIPIEPLHDLKRFVQQQNIRLAVLTTPAEVAQELADLVVSAGVKAIWNFTPTRLTVPPGILVRNEHISIGLSEIAYHLKQ